MSEVRLTAVRRTSTSVLHHVPPEDLQFATCISDPADSAIFDAPTKPSKAPSSARKRTKRPANAPNSKQQCLENLSSTSCDDAVALAPVVSAPISESERKAQRFLYDKLIEAVQQTEKQFDAENADKNSSSHSIANGSYIEETCPLTMIQSVFSKPFNNTIECALMGESYAACIELIATQVYNEKADDMRCDRLLTGKTLPEEYMELVRKADKFRVWRCMLYTSIMVNINREAEKQRAFELYDSAEDDESLTIPNPLALQKFFGYLMWIPAKRSINQLAGKGRCYVCSCPLREGQSYNYLLPRLTATDRTAVPNSSVSNEQTGFSNIATTHQQPIRTETLSENSTDFKVYFQICSQCDEMTTIFLSSRDGFRNERNAAILTLRDIVNTHSAMQQPPPSLKKFVAEYMKRREPKRVWQDEKKRLRAIINSLGSFLRRNCSESMARATRNLYHDIFKRDDDPRANPFDCVVEHLDENAQRAVSLMHMTVEERLQYLQQRIDPHNVDSVNRIWTTMKSV